MKSKRSERIALAALAAAGCLWGTGFVFGKMALTEMGVGHFVLCRFLFAAVALLPVAIQQRIGLPRRADLFRILVSGALYVPIQFLVQFEGLARTTVSHASLMVGGLPVLVAVAATIFTRESLDRTGWILLATSTLGAALIVSGGSAAGQASVRGDLLVAVSLLASVGWVLTSKQLMREDGGYSPVAASVYVLYAGTMLLALWVFAMDGAPPVALPMRTWLAVAGAGVAATALTTVLWNWGLTRVPASRAGIFLNFEPVIGVILGIALFHDRLGPMTIVGGALIIGAAVVFSRRRPG